MVVHSRDLHVRTYAESNKHFCVLPLAVAYSVRASGARFFPEASVRGIVPSVGVWDRREDSLDIPLRAQCAVSVASPHSDNPYPLWNFSSSSTAALVFEKFLLVLPGRVRRYKRYVIFQLDFPYS